MFFEVGHVRNGFLKGVYQRLSPLAILKVAKEAVKYYPNDSFSFSTSEVSDSIVFKGGEVEKLTVRKLKTMLNSLKKKNHNTIIL